MKRLLSRLLMAFLLAVLDRLADEAARYPSAYAPPPPPEPELGPLARLAHAELLVRAIARPVEGLAAQGGLFMERLKEGQA